jgi:hypothetical protein
VGVAALLFFSAILVALGVSGSGVVAGYAIGGVILSIVGLIGAAFVKSHPRLASAAMLISGGLGFSVVLGFRIGALLLLVAGIIGLIRKEKSVEPTPATPSLPVRFEEEKARAEVEIGSIAYWPPGKALCIFFGATPVSKREEPRAYGSVNVFAKVVGDPTVFRKVRDDDEVILERHES